MPERPNRRRFLQTSSAAGALLAVGVHSQLAAQESNAANAKLNIGIVGAGGRGRDNMGVSRARISLRSVMSTRTTSLRRSSNARRRPSIAIGGS